MTWLLEQLVKETKGHPITLLIILGLVGYAVYSHNNHATASDLADINHKLDESVETIKNGEKINTCRWLSDKISDTKTEIYILERDGADPKWINEKKDELHGYESRYKATTCNTTNY